MIGKGVEAVVETFAEMAGKPRLVGRDWLGYLGKLLVQVYILLVDCMQGPLCYYPTRKTPKNYWRSGLRCAASSTYLVPLCTYVSIYILRYA